MTVRDEIRIIRRELNNKAAKVMHSCVNTEQRKVAWRYIQLKNRTINIMERSYEAKLPNVPQAQHKNVVSPNVKKVGLRRLF